MTIAAFIEKSLVAESPESLFACYLQALGKYGFDRAVHSAVRNSPLGDTEIPIISHAYPDDWVSYYFANDYFSKDPTCIASLGSRNVFSWQDMIEQRELSPTQELIMNQGEEAGLFNGVTVPFHGPMGEVFIVGLACSNPNPDAGEFLKEIQVLSTQFHVLNSAFYDQKRNASFPKLTPRELEVLKWCAAGKTNWCISEILGISEHGVSFHIRNIMRKFNADTRVTAIVKALQCGQITL